MMVKKIVTVVHSKSCTHCVLDHMRAAARTKKEKAVLKRFEMADERFRKQLGYFRIGFDNLKMCRDLFDVDNASVFDTLLNELSILELDLPYDCDMPF